MLKEMDKGGRQNRALAYLVPELQQLVPSLHDLGEGGTRSLLEDLARANLIRLNTDSVLSKGIVALQERWTTNWGHQFLEFITAPPEAK